MDVVDNPLVNALHARWNLAAVRAGKHVLAEKPFAANAEQAAVVSAAAVEAGVTVVEVFHYQFHPLFQRVCELVGAGAIGDVVDVEAMLRMPAPPDSDPRWSLELAGGAARTWVATPCTARARSASGSSAGSRWL